MTGGTMTEATTRTLEVPGAVLTYDQFNVAAASRTLEASDW